MAVKGGKGDILLFLDDSRPASQAKACFQPQSFCRGLLPDLTPLRRAACDTLAQRRQVGFALPLIDPVQPILATGNRARMQYAGLVLPRNTLLAKRPSRLDTMTGRTDTRTYETAER